jgi:hypothetical protein
MIENESADALGARGSEFNFDPERGYLQILNRSHSVVSVV